MQLGAPGIPKDAGTVAIRVQVIDLEPFALNMVVPTYLPIRDLTQRVARDAGLGAYWEDGTRRNFYLRARGRLLGPDEKLQDLGIVANELLHLLPEPPKGSGLEERPPGYPKNQGYSGAGYINIAGGFGLVILWSLSWAAALNHAQSIWVTILPATGLALLTTSLSRHLWGGTGGQIRIPLTSVAMMLPLVVISMTPSFFSGIELTTFAIRGATAVIFGILGVMVGWLAWYGAVEPLPKVKLSDVKDAEAAITWPCGICGGPVTADVKADCMYRCGRVFHQGCYQAKNAMSDGSRCAVCGIVPPRAA